MPTMLSVGVEVRLDTSHGGIGRKMLTTAVDLARVKVYHRCSPERRHWLFRLLDFADLRTHAYEGHVEPPRITTLGVHLWDVLFRSVFPVSIME